MKSVEQYVTPVLDIANEAADAIRQLAENRDQLIIHTKKDGSPVTNADLRSHEIISQGLKRLTPEIPLISEEDGFPDYNVRSAWPMYWLSDPLDGTHGFIEGSNDVTVNIALIVNHQPVLGVVVEPVHARQYIGGEGVEAICIDQSGDSQTISVDRVNQGAFRFIVGNQSKGIQIRAIQKDLPHSSLMHLGSSAKLLRIAEGAADVYCRFGNISEWDIAAGHSILEAAGGKVVDFSGESLQYNRQDSLLCPPLMAIGDNTQIERLITLFNKGEDL